MLVTRYSCDLDTLGKDYLDRIRASATRMQALIIDLLAYSRISTRSQPLNEVDLNLILEQVLVDLELKIEESQAAIRLDDLPVIYADATQMHQLCFNLVGNSLKFKAPDKPSVIDISGKLITTSSHGKGLTTWHEIRVKDNGIGFDEKYLDRIFQPFQRLYNQTEYEGNGMGLAICRKIVERHGGNITAKSKPGQGATFIVRLPVIQDIKM
jgi:light-regulated signal transduction histidine kinase (bacteriophytochrome)